MVLDNLAGKEKRDTPGRSTPKAELGWSGAGKSAGAGSRHRVGTGAGELQLEIPPGPTV